MQLSSEFRQKTTRFGQIAIFWEGDGLIWAGFDLIWAGSSLIWAVTS